MNKIYVVRTQYTKEFVERFKTVTGYTVNTEVIIFLDYEDANDFMNGKLAYDYIDNSYKLNTDIEKVLGMFVFDRDDARINTSYGYDFIALENLCV